MTLNETLTHLDDELRRGISTRIAIGQIDISLERQESSVDCLAGKRMMG
jgi:hypothetical protein